MGDLQQSGDIAAAQRLDVSGDLVQRQHHVLEQAYASLGPARQKLLSRIACFRSPVKYDALNALAGTGSAELSAATASREERGQIAGEGSIDADIRDLVSRGLLHRDLENNRYDLHPIVRRYAYDRLAAPDRTGAHIRLRNYFATVPCSDTLRSLDDLAPIVELYHHTVRAGQFDEGSKLLLDRLWKPSYFQFGAYQLLLDLLRALFPDGEEQPPFLKNESLQALTLGLMASSYCLSGRPARAVKLIERSLAISEKQGLRQNVAMELASVSSGALLPLGRLGEAEANLRRSVAISKEIRDEVREAIGHADLGRLLVFRGALAQSDRELARALELLEKHKRIQWQGVVWAYRAHRELVRLRFMSHNSVAKPRMAKFTFAISSARRALDLADKTAESKYPFERDYIRAYWLMGAAYCVAGKMNEAEYHLNAALQRCRRNNTVETEAEILVDLARLSIATSAPDEAKRLAEEALLITERCGYVMQGADAHLVLAQLAKDRDDAKALRGHATEALRLATCDGPPDYTYKVAFDEATALVKG